MKSRKLIVFVALIVSLLGVSLFVREHSDSQTYAQTSVSPLSPLPTPTSTPVVSAYGQQALAYVSDKYGIPIEHLLIEREIEGEYPLSGHTYRHILIADTHMRNRPTYDISVEVNTGTIEEDIGAIEKVEEAAYLAKCGHTSRSLCEMLQQVTDGAFLPVMIWVSGQPMRTEQEIQEILLSEFPQAREAVAAGSKPIDVDDMETAQQIQARYEELLGENLAARKQPTQEWLRQKGYTFMQMEGIPVLAVVLPKKDILELAYMEEHVGMIYLAGPAADYPGSNPVPFSVKRLFLNTDWPCNVTIRWLKPILKAFTFITGC